MTRRPPVPRQPAELAGLLTAGAAGLLAETAAVQLLAACGWLDRPDFTGPHIRAGNSPLSGQPLAHVRWTAATRALAAGKLPATPSERNIVQIAASLAAGTPVRLGDAVTGLDRARLAAVTAAIWHTGGCPRR